MTGSTGFVSGTTGSFTDTGNSANNLVLEDSVAMVYFPSTVMGHYNATSWNDRITGDASADAEVR